MVENSPCNAGDTGLIPCLGSSHTPRGYWVRVPQPLCPRTCAALQEKPLQWEAHSLAVTRENLHNSSEDPAQPKIKKERQGVRDSAGVTRWLQAVLLEDGVRVGSIVVGVAGKVVLRPESPEPCMGVSFISLMRSLRKFPSRNFQGCALGRFYFHRGRLKWEKDGL